MTKFTRAYFQRMGRLGRKRQNCTIAQRREWGKAGALKRWKDHKKKESPNAR
jgi:hypothetical protein